MTWPLLGWIGINGEYVNARSAPNAVDIPQRLRRTLALVLAGGRGSRLRALTDWHAKPAIPFGGKFRIIDFALSNCINSGIRRISVLTQYKAHSLIQHIQRGWGFLRGEFNEFIELLPAQQRTEGENWYRGTANAVSRISTSSGRHGRTTFWFWPETMSTRWTMARCWPITWPKVPTSPVGCIEVPLEGTGFGVMAVDPEGNVLRFDEKPAEAQSIPGRPDVAWPAWVILHLQCRIPLRPAGRGTP